MTTQDLLNEKTLSVLAQQTTKTSKIKQLLGLGLSRRQVTDIIAVYYEQTPNYGFVQNVYAKIKADNLEITAKKQSLIITDFAVKSEIALITGMEINPKQIILLS